MANKEQDSSTGQVVKAKEQSVSTTKPEKHEEKKHSLIVGVGQFLKEVAIEHRKITWPDNKQVVRETWSVLFLVTAITLVVLGIDWVLGNVIFGPIEHWARLHGAGLGRG
jgi:preprotein translocase SecE subunit